MRIAYVVPSLVNKGPIIVVKNLVNYLKKRGYDVDVYYFDESSFSMDFECRTMRIAMSYAINFDDYDIVHSHCLRPNMYVVRWISKIHKAKTISTIHQNAYIDFKYKYNIVFSSILAKYFCYLQSKFDGIVCISKQISCVYKDKLRNSVVTIYNGCTIDMTGVFKEEILNSILNLRMRYKILGSYAVVSRRKGLNQIVEVLKYLPDYALVIIGDGPDVAILKDMASKLHIGDRVLFFSYQENPCIYLSYFDIYVMPSYSEGFGLAVVEAALAGKSIVCSNIPSFHEIFSKSEVAFFELDNMVSLRDAIKSAYDNKENYGSAARLRAQTEFSVQRMAERYLNYYEYILDK